MATKKEKVEDRKLHIELIKQMGTLLTSGFSLVAALAWNDAIQSFVKEYIEARIPGSGLLWKFIYALLITFLVVFFTYQLSSLAARFGQRRK